MYLQKYISTALQLIAQYPYPLPFATYLKQYFSLNKKHGSKDRKFITDACYAFWRLGSSLAEIPVEEQILVAVFLSPKANNWIIIFKEDWQVLVTETLKKRIDFIQTIYPNFNTQNIFSWQSELSPSINKNAFALSLLLPNKTFLRLRPKYVQKVEQGLQHNNIIYQKIADNYIAFSEPINFEKFVHLNKQAVVQDYSSGRVLDYFATHAISFNEPITLWDCCSASGGKSILAVDYLPIKKLIVTDVRQSILTNLQRRFKEAGLTNYQTFIMDAAKGKIDSENYDIVLADCPCTGSGTWGRNPENLKHFNKESIPQYSTIQKNITQNVSKAVKINGYLVYITCSVFKEENEDIVQHILQKTSLSLVHQELILGYLQQADTMFVAVFKNIVK